MDDSLIYKIDTVVITRVDTVVISKLDTLIIYDVPQRMLNPYIEILEKTNEQLSLWSNPYTWTIATLAILFTLLTIIAAIFIWNQSEEFKKLVNRTINKYETIFSNLLDQKKNQLLKLEKTYEVQIQEAKEKLEKETTQNKKELQQAIADLEKRKDAIKEEIKAPSINPLGEFFICPNCGNPFFETESEQSFSMLVLNKDIKCPKCSHEFVKP
ncbi:MAG: hypothetical protein RJQ09_04220 [Cyclobacteriaceae bacterium]